MLVGLDGSRLVLKVGFPGNRYNDGCFPEVGHCASPAGVLKEGVHMDESSAALHSELVDPVQDSNM